MGKTIPPPSQRALGRKGRGFGPEESKQYFRWLFMYKVGQHLGDNVSYRSLARKISRETGEIVSESRIRYGCRSVERRLPPLRLANKTFRRQLEALRTSGCVLPE